MLPALQLDSVSKRYGNRIALRPTSLSALPGELIALMGPNGAGKTTLLKIAAGILKSTEGRAYAFGKDPLRDCTVRSRTAYLGHELGLYDELTAAENLRFYAALYGVKNPEPAVSDGLRTVGLSDRASDRVGSFSRGMRERLGLARLTLHSPDLILLDEATAGLDSAALGILAGLCKKWRGEDRTVLLSTHDFAFAEEVGMKVFTIS